MFRVTAVMAVFVLSSLFLLSNLEGMAAGDESVSFKKDVLEKKFPTEKNSFV